MADATFVQWLIEAGAGPAAVALPMHWAAGAVAGAARRWWAAFREKDDLSRLVKAAAGDAFDLDEDEFHRVRELLCESGTWRLIGEATINNATEDGTVEALRSRIAASLPPREGRSKEQSDQAAAAIARGLLEFVAWDLDPTMFQQVLVARLDRLAADQASLFEVRLRELHADLYSDTVELLTAHAGRVDELGQAQEDLRGLLELREKLQRQQYRSVVEQLKVLAVRLPARPAGRGDLRVYLEELVARLDEDRWPRRLGGPMLSPSAIERTLHVKATGRVDELVVADEVADRCHRLVILGEPGAGKTWLAKRTARRCAERALAALNNSISLEAIELPLYMTCRDLLTQVGNINEAVAAAAIDHMSYLGPLRQVEALRLFFANRETSMLVVIDSLDEAASLDQRRLNYLDNVDWRIVLTSRPSAWTAQLNLNERNDTHVKGWLQPLSYPDDVNPFIERWFNQDPAQADQLIKQIESRPDLQTSATVPLLLAFYCIIAGREIEPLPRFRRELYDRLIRRLLSGYWRNPHNNIDIDAGELQKQLRNWAWQAAHNHSYSELGDWQDEFPTPAGTLPQEAREVLGHIAAVTGELDVDTGTVPRRFIHRTVHEHLVAQYMADPTFRVIEVADELLAHLWYDPDWEYAAPAAIAARDDRNLLVRILLRRAAPTRLPIDVSAINAGHELTRFLVRLATETNETDWSQDTAHLINQARLHLAQAGQLDLVTSTAHWATTNPPIRVQLINKLAHATFSWDAEPLVAGLVQLATEPEDKAQARAALVDLLARTTHDSAAEPLVSGLVQLDPTPQDRAQARAALVDLLTHADALSEIAVRQVSGLVQLATEPEDKAEVRRVVLDLLPHPHVYEDAAVSLVSGLGHLDPTPDDRAQARAAVIDLLTNPQIYSQDAQSLVSGLGQLATEPEDKAEVRRVVLDLLPHTGWNTTSMVSGLGQLATEPEDKAEVRRVVLDLLVATNDSFNAGPLVSGLVQLDPTPQDNAEIRRAMVDLLTNGRIYGAGVESLVSGLVQLDPTPQDNAEIRRAMVDLLAATNDSFVAAPLVSGLVQLDPTPQDKAQARAAVVNLLTDTTIFLGHVEPLVSGLVQLDPTPQDKVKARGAVVDRVTPTNDIGLEATRQLVSGLVQLATEPEDKAQARTVLVDLLTLTTSSWVAGELMSGLAQLAPTPQDLVTSPQWAATPSHELLHATRHNATIEEWLDTFPLLAASLPHRSAAQSDWRSLAPPHHRPGWERG